MVAETAASIYLALHMEITSTIIRLHGNRATMWQQQKGKERNRLDNCKFTCKKVQKIKALTSKQIAFFCKKKHAVKQISYILTNRLRIRVMFTWHKNNIYHCPSPTLWKQRK